MISLTCPHCQSRTDCHLPADRLDTFAASLGWTQAPTHGLFATFPAPGAVARVRALATGPMAYPGLRVVGDPIEGRWVWLLFADSTVRDGFLRFGVELAGRPLPEGVAGEWFCSVSCLAAKLQSTLEIRGDKWSIDGGRDAHLPSLNRPDPPRPPEDVPVPCSACGARLLLPPHIAADPVARERYLRAHSWRPGFGENVHCGETCALASFTHPAQPEQIRQPAQAAPKSPAPRRQKAAR